MNELKVNVLVCLVCRKYVHENVLVALNREMSYIGLSLGDNSIHCDKPDYCKVTGKLQVIVVHSDSRSDT